MKDTWVTSDTHFNHKNILKYQPNRLFTTLEEHDDTLIDNWNKTVKPNDDIWFLGDFAFCSQVKALEYMNRLNGNIHFIIGNHDHKIVKNINFQKRLSFLGDYKQLKGFHRLPIVLSHYPFCSWSHSYHGSYHLHGHSHNSLDNTGTRRIDVGIDSRSVMRPYHIDEILSKV